MCAKGLRYLRAVSLGVYDSVTAVCQRLVRVTCKRCRLRLLPGTEGDLFISWAPVVKLVDTSDLKSAASNRAYRFDSGPGHHSEN